MNYRDSKRLLRTAIRKSKKLWELWEMKKYQQELLSLELSNIKNKDKPKKPKKKKARSRSKVVRELDSVISQFIRLLYSDKFWNCTCYTCGKVDNRKNMQCWHFITRGCYRYRWEAINLRVQCVGCNIYLHWNYIEFTRRMIDELGREVVDEMIMLKNQIKSFKTYELEEMIVTLKEKVAEISQ